MLKILQVRLQHHVNRELQMFKFQLEKAGEPETASYPFYHLFKYKKQNANIRWIIEKSREFQKNIYSCFIDYAKDFDCVDHSKLWKILKEMGIPDHLSCLLRNLYTGQEATFRTGHGTADGSK